MLSKNDSTEQHIQPRGKWRLITCPAALNERGKQHEQQTNPAAKVKCAARSSWMKSDVGSVVPPEPAASSEKATCASTARSSVNI